MCRTTARSGATTSASIASVLPHELSGRQKQYVAIARAINSEPSPIIMDEPTSSPDTGISESINVSIFLTLTVWCNGTAKQ
ncbi:ATP-binding cassette domain-containing protein [Paenibacillus xylanexedens]|uniref:ATP-binding cassette domain-containing protein n=1 Tax=Paenibacillus xylanexedens TaxID=528191 RepID=UPI003CFCC38D